MPDNSSSCEPYRLEGPALVLAPPGTGKTYQLARRVKWLVEEQDVPPDSLTVITFTNNAAQEMRERLADPSKPELYISPEARPSNIRTMHSLGWEIVRAAEAARGSPPPDTPLPADDDVELLMEDAAQLIGESRSAAKETLLCRRFGACMRDEATTKCRICAEYRAITAACNAVDYDDQVLLACEYLESNPELLNLYRSKAQHLLVDEYQDVNAAQLGLIRMLAQGSLKGLFVVGDDDQSIYSWRGGSPKYIRGFEEQFCDGPCVVNLKKSRRCQPHILYGAVHVVKQYDGERLRKVIKGFASTDGPKIQIHGMPSDRREAERVLKIVRCAVPGRSVLVLVPTRSHGTLVCEYLRRAGIHYLAHERPPGEGLDLLRVVLTVAQSPTDQLALRCSLQAMVDGCQFGVPGPAVRSEPKRREREEALSALSSLWKDVLTKGTPLWDSLCAHGPENALLEKLYQSLVQLRNCAQAGVPQFLRWVAESLRPWPNVERLSEEILWWTGQVAGARRGGDGNVCVMTMQGAKGLEADVVCVLGLEDGTLPRRGAEGAELAEQARLLYVSMTRARTELHLFHARKRSGQVSLQSPYRGDGRRALDESPFLAAIPSDHAERIYHPPRG